MGPAISRRRFLSISAATAGLTALGGAAPAAEPWEWRGNALGADCTIRLYHPERAAARALIRACVAETDRLEAIFSLYRDDSALCRLNRDGGLAAPPQELVEVMSLAIAMSRRSQGRFDVTVQPLWTLYAEHFAKTGADPSGPDDSAIARVLPLVGWQGLLVEPGRIGFARRGMAVTLNGIAQGYITDRIADLLRRQGMRAVLVDLGEIAVLGPKGDGKPWRVGAKGAGEVLLSEGALAASDAGGTRFSACCHHIFDPRTGHSALDIGPVMIKAGRAIVADAMSTAVAAGFSAVEREGCESGCPNGISR